MTETLDGVTAETVTTARIKTLVRRAGAADGEPVLLMHGNISSSVFFEETLVGLPDGLCGYTPDLRGFGGTEAAPVDATRGLRDYADDLAALLDALGLESVHLLGWSMGGGVVMRFLIDHPQRVRSLVLVNPVSPYGFGGTRDTDGTLLSSDGAGSGAGSVNPEFVARIASGDRDGTDSSSPRAVMNSTYFKPPFHADREDALVDSMLTTRVGDDFYPGDSRPSDAWPGVAPGTRGVLNTMAPTYCNLTGIVDIAPKPPVLWVRGSDDQIVADASMMDVAALGRLGVVPGWPGSRVAPPQPMVAQTHAVLDRYAEAGGDYREVVIDDTGHSPHIEKPAEFREAVFTFLQH